MCRLICGDCMELLPEIQDGSVDMVLCDMPYGSTQNTWDQKLPLDKLWEQYSRIVKEHGAICLFADGMFLADLMKSNRKMWRYNLIWDKVIPTGFLNANRMPLRRTEEIAVFYRKQPLYHPQKVPGKPNHSKGRAVGNRAGQRFQNRDYGDYAVVDNSKDLGTWKHPTSLISIPKPHASKCLHPTEKPVALCEWLIRTYTDPGETVLDNCMGSGSTGVACIGSGRRFVGIEADEGYYGIAKNRIENAAAQNRLDLFGGDGGPGNPSSCRQATADRELPACEPMTVGAMIYGADYLTGLPDFDRGVPILCGADHESDPDVTAKTMCQHPAKSDGETTWYPDAETALRHVKKGLLQLGA